MKKVILSFITALVLAPLSAVQAADCAQANTVTNGSTVLNKSLWDGEFSNIVTCINNRLEESGGTMTGTLTMSGADIAMGVGRTVDGVDISELSNSSAAKLSKSGDTMTGNLNMHVGADINMYSDSGTSLAMSVDGTSGNVTTIGHMTIASAKNFYLDGGGDSYISHTSSNNIDFLVGGNTRLSIYDPSALVYTGGGTDFAIQSGRRIYLDGGGNTYISESAADTISVYTNNTEGMKINGSGKLYFPNNSSWSNSGTANLRIDTSTGEIIIAGSSQRFKTEITDIEVDTGKVFDLRPVSFSSKDENSGKRYVGFIAEEVEQVVPELVDYNSAGEIQGVMYDRVSVLMLAEMKKMSEQIGELQLQVEDLKKQINTDATNDSQAEHDSQAPPAEEQISEQENGADIVN